MARPVISPAELIAVDDIPVVEIPDTPQARVLCDLLIEAQTRNFVEAATAS